MSKITESEKVLVGIRRRRLAEWFSGGYPEDEKSYISQLINGKGSFGSKAARRLEEDYKMPKMFLDSSGPILQDKNSAFFDYLDIKAACGSGYINHDEPANVARIETTLDFAQNLIGGINKSGHVKLFSARGDSMEPTINPRDLLFVDTEHKEVIGEGIYLILHCGGLSCKRLLKVGKRIRVCSDNELHRDKDWDWDDKDETTRIVGKVVASLPLAIRRFE